MAIYSSAGSCVLCVPWRDATAHALSLSCTFAAYLLSGLINDFWVKNTITTDKKRTPSWKFLPWKVSLVLLYPVILEIYRNLKLPHNGAFRFEFLMYFWCTFRTRQPRNPLWILTLYCPRVFNVGKTARQHQIPSNRLISVRPRFSTLINPHKTSCRIWQFAVTMNDQRKFCCTSSFCKWGPFRTLP